MQPFYSYHVSTLTQTSPELGKTFRNQMLSLTTDLEGASRGRRPVPPSRMRAGGWGALLARSRYMFMKLHRARFGDRTLAELRGVMDEAGNAPFWDGLAGRFFGMTFPEADEFNAVHGTQFIADLMPKTPIYVDLLAESAKAVMGQPHPSGPRGAADARAGGFPVRSLHRHLRRRADGHRADRPDPHHPRGEHRGRCRNRRWRGGQNAGRGGAAQGIPGLLRVGRRVPKKGVCIDREAAELLEVEVGDASRSSPGDAARDQFRRDRRAEPQLCRAEPRQSRIDRQCRRRFAAARRRASRRGQDARQSRARPGPGDFPAAATASPGLVGGAWHDIDDADPALAANAMSASSMWAANAATVSPAPDTSDGKCHLTVANLRTMPHRSHEWPATLAQLKLAFRSEAFAVHGPVPPAFGDEGAANHMRLAAAHGEPGVEVFVYGVSRGAFPARQHIEASKAIARLHRLDPSARSSPSSRSRRLPRVRSTTMSSRWRTSACCSRTNRRSPTRPRWSRALERRAGLRICRGARRRGAAGGRRALLSVQRAAGHAAWWRADADRADRGAGDSVRVELDRAAHRRQRPDPPGRSGRRPPIDGEWRRAGVPAPARRRGAASVDPRFMVDDAKLDAIADVIGAHWPEQIHIDDLQRPALIADIERARSALLEVARPRRAGLTPVPLRDSGKR